MKQNRIIFLFIFLSALRSDAAIRYVTVSGAGAMDGTAWANAFPGTSLQAAINASAPGDEVWVAAGTYITTSTANRNIYFNMLNGVAIYGSFAGTEISLSQRIFTCGFSSVLSAEIGAAGIADNSYHVISNTSLNSTAILDGFTITGGNANFDIPGNDSRSHGGGMLNLASNGGLCSPTIRNCLFMNNTAVFGGGMFNNGFNTGNANPVLINCILAFNTATLGGGGMDNFGYAGSASPSLTNCIFYSNTAVQRAGAMYCWGGGGGNASPVILNSAFINNSSADGGAFVSDRTNTGGGSSGTADPDIRNSILWGNTAAGAGPQFFILGAASFTVTYSVIDISNQNPPHIITGPGTGNIFIAPVFFNAADADGADNCWLTADDGLQLQLISPGIDAGDNTGTPAFDIRNHNRIANTVVDMGAYEFNAAVVPVRLIGFSGKPAGAVNILTWSTASEADNILFEVERSDDALHFEKKGEKSGAGNSSVQRDYHFIDDRIEKEKYYYRLKQIDSDGGYTFSNVILVISNRNKQDILLFPNPVISTATVLFPDESLSGKTLTLFNSYGQRIRDIIVSGRSAVADMTKEPAGLYFLVNAGLGIIIKVVRSE